MAPTLSARELSRTLQPTADRYRSITEPFTGDQTLPPAMQLASVAGEIAVLTSYVLGTCGDPHGTGRHNLQSLRALALRLAELSTAALRVEPVPYSPYE